MDKEALAEVDDIISLLSKEYQSKIPKKLKEFIKKNKDSLYKSNITELPRDISGLKKDTVVMLGMIYDKYIYDKFDMNPDIDRPYIMYGSGTYNITTIDTNTCAVDAETD